MSEEGKDQKVDVAVVELKGSCCCEKVHFSVECDGAIPFQLCYCTYCVKMTGAGTINLLGKLSTLKVEGEEFVKKFAITNVDPETGETRKSKHERSFCVECGTHLWAAAPTSDWPDLVHPVATAIDTPLPTPHQRFHIFKRSVPAWMADMIPDESETNKVFDKYPDKWLIHWHEENQDKYTEYFADHALKK